MPRVLLLMGPTASGKSALAIALAQRLRGVIVNADSMQVYRDLRILTARPSPSEEAEAPHRLYGEIDAAVRFSVGAWLERAMSEIAAIRAEGLTPILAGGTGLYFRALTQGLAAIPSASADLRAALSERLERLGSKHLHAELAAADPETAARVRPSDSIRILRALEVLAMTGRSISALHREPATPPLAPGAWGGFSLTPPRAELYARIDARLDAMLSEGALEEARALFARGLDPMLPAMKAHGMPHFSAHFRGEIALAEAAARAKLDTRHYAKRQFTWIAHQLPGFAVVGASAPEERLAAILAAAD